jgi:hypothetical protein
MSYRDYETPAPTTAAYPNAGSIGGALIAGNQNLNAKQSPIDAAFSDLELEQKRMSEAIARLNDRLTGVLGPGVPQSGATSEKRGRHGAPLADAIQTQAEVLGRHVALIQEITERLAL